MHISLNSIIGKFKPINGISCYDSSSPEEFFSHGFPSVRLHDQDGNRPFVVDIAAVFPFWGANELDPSSYDFRDTDRIIGDLVSHGVEVIYRLGNTIDHTPFPRLSRVPNDFGKWARVCEHIIMHYNEGWKDGFHYNIKYWEIWNEPDLIYLGLFTMWQGTEEEFFELYRVTAPYLKKRFPNVKIGGYGAARTKVDFFEHFLQVASNEQLPLDFFSWHRYTNEVEDIIGQADRVRKMLDDYGFQKTESILDEWAYTENDWFGKNRWGLFGKDPKIKESFYTKMRSQVGASYALAVMISLLDHPVDKAHIYDGQKSFFGGLYDPFGNYTKLAHSLFAFNVLISRQNRVNTAEAPKDVFTVASRNESGADIMISCFETKSSEETLVIEGCSGLTCGSIYLTDDFFCNEKIIDFHVENDKLELPISVRPYTVIHISIK